MSLNIRSRLFLWFLFISVIPLILIGGFSYYLIVEKISTQNEETLTNVNKGILNMVDTQRKVLNRWLESTGTFLNEKVEALGETRFDYKNKVKFGNYYLPTWYIGKQKISNDNSLVDNMLEKKYMACSFFQLHRKKLIRVNSSVMRQNGTRITGSILAYPHIYNNLINGKPYLGRANVEGIWYATIYHPLKNSNGKIIGAIGMGRREQQYELVQAIKNIIVGETGYVFVMDPQGNLIIHPNLQGQNLSENNWVKKIIKKKNGSITYNFNNRKKIAYFSYYKPWNWHIVTGGYVSEIFNTPSKLSNILLLTILAVILISLLIAYILSRTFSKPINNLMRVMGKAQKGDLSARFNYSYYNEFKILNNALSAMLDNISNLIGRIGSNSGQLKASSKCLVEDINDSEKSLRKLEKDVDNFQKNISLTENDDDKNRINNIKIEVQKLKLLLKNIDNSASTLDDIALSLDQHVNLFIIDNEKLKIK